MRLNVMTASETVCKVLDPGCGHGRLVRRAGRLAVCLLILSMITGCGLWLNDRCWVPPEQYAQAREVFIETGSLDLVEQRMRQQQWRRCRRNETLYRLEKEFTVLPEEVPVYQAEELSSEP